MKMKKARSAHLKMVRLGLVVLIKHLLVHNSRVSYKEPRNVLGEQLIDSAFQERLEIILSEWELGVIVIACRSRKVHIGGGVARFRD